MKIWLLLFSLLFSTACYSQSIDNNIRPSFTLKLFVNDSTFYTALMDPTSYIIKGQTVQIFPGEKLFIEADILKDSLVNLKAMPEILNKEKTIIIIFTQVHQDRKHEKMVLNIINPFSKDLEYSSRINLMKYKKWVKTDVLPFSMVLRVMKAGPILLPQWYYMIFILRIEIKNLKYRPARPAIYRYGGTTNISCLFRS